MRWTQSRCDPVGLLDVSVAASRRAAPTMTVIEVKPHRWGWKVFEDPGIEPVFPAKAIAVLPSFTASQLLP
jgi:hypothetical protein